MTGDYHAGVESMNLIMDNCDINSEPDIKEKIELIRKQECKTRKKENNELVEI